MTVADAARELGISTQRVRRMIKTGLLPAQKLSERVMVIAASDVAGLVRRKAGKPKAGA